MNPDPDLPSCRDCTSTDVCGCGCGRCYDCVAKAKSRVFEKYGGKTKKRQPKKRDATKVKVARKVARKARKKNR